MLGRMGRMALDIFHENADLETGVLIMKQSWGWGPMK